MSEPKKKKPKSENKKSNSKIKNNNRVKKKNVVRKSLSDDGIAKSKQLVQKLQTTKSSSYGRPKVRTSIKDDELRLCGNGKPMPSLSELEKMFEDSDDDEENKPATPNNTIPSTPKNNPKPKPEEKLISPTTISEIANRVLHLVSNISDPSELLEETPPPIIKPKKRKKPDEPYIVGCKDRPKVPQKPSVKFCKGDDKYGPDSNDEEDDDLPKKRAKRGKKLNISKSIFNAKSDEIAAHLKECDGDSDGSSDSNKTVAYEYYTPINSSSQRTFSPLPSTSKDNETFVKNDQRFNESLISENISKSNLEDDIEILETPCETIEINDTISYNNTSKLDGSIIEITDDSSTYDFDDKLVVSSKTVNMNDDSLQVQDVKPVLNTDLNTDDDCVQVVQDIKPASPDDCEQVVQDTYPASPILVKDYYSNLNIENIANDDVCEVIDIDDLIAQNKAIIEKYKKNNSLDTVTLVDASDINTTVPSNHNKDKKDSKREETIKVTEPAENNILSNEQSSVIFMNIGETSHRPMLAGNNVDVVEVIDDFNYHPILSDNVPRNHRAAESILIDLEPLQNCTNINQESHNNAMRNNQPVTTNHRCNCVTDRREFQTTHHYNHLQSNSAINNFQPSHTLSRCHHPTECDVNCEIQPSASKQDNCCNSTPNNDSYQQQLKILTQFFERRQKNGESRNRQRKKKSLRISENLLSQNFTSWLQSMTNNIPKPTTENNKVQPRNRTSSPTSTPNSNSPTSKRIGDCPICMDSLSNKLIVSTICGHVFCMDCIKLSIKSNGNKCPTCRKALKKGTGYHQIFL